MEKRKLGNTSLQIAPLVLGGNVFGWTADEKMSFMLLDEFTERGFNCIDTADGYSLWAPGNKGGESETIIGNWLKKSGKRKQVIIATKVGWEIAADKKGLAKNYILSQVESSLKRLRTDYIDLYQSHKDDPSTPIEETLEAYEQLIREGKVRFVGASNFTAERLEESLQVAKERNLPAYTTFQPKYNLYDREFETTYGNLVKRYHLGVITYHSLARGFLSGKYRTQKDFSKSPRGEAMDQCLNDKGMRVLKVLEDLSRKYQGTPASISLAWLMAKPLVTAPIASATTTGQLNELMRSAAIHLSIEDLELLDAAGNQPKAKMKQFTL